MARSKRKAQRKKGKGRRITFIIIPAILVLFLAVFLTLWKAPPEKKREGEIVPPPIPAEEKKEGKKEEKKEEIPHPPPPRLALIIDDGGYNITKFKGMLGMGKAMTFAILPNTPHAREVALLAHRDGSEVMLHLPMEPQEEEFYPLEKDTILTAMSHREIQKILLKDLRQIPYVRGVNNHMGSKATEDPKVMRALMETLKKEKLYFIDSHTSSHSLGPEMAQRVGVAFALNGKFIDREDDIDAIKEAIRLAMAKAKKEGKAVAIGHPHPLTARAIRAMIPEIEREGIRLVFASEVVG
jgi:polysaccharide deacetylase 2 family uncharacterized protein YibQ